MFLLVSRVAFIKKIQGSLILNRSVSIHLNLSYLILSLFCILLVFPSSVGAQDNIEAPQIVGFGKDGNEYLLPGEPIILRYLTSWQNLANSTNAAVRVECRSTGQGVFPKYRSTTIRRNINSITSENQVRLNNGVVDSNESAVSCQVCNGIKENDYTDFNPLSCSDRVTYPVYNLPIKSHSNWDRITPGTIVIDFDPVENAAGYSVTTRELDKNSKNMTSKSYALSALSNKIEITTSAELDLLNVVIEAKNNFNSTIRSGNYTFVTFKKGSITSPFSSRKEVGALKVDLGERRGDFFTIADQPLTYYNMATGRSVGSFPKEFGPMEATFCMNFDPNANDDNSFKNLDLKILSPYCPSANVVGF